MTKDDDEQRQLNNSLVVLITEKTGCRVIKLLLGGQLDPHVIITYLCMMGSSSSRIFANAFANSTS